MECAQQELNRNKQIPAIHKPAVEEDEDNSFTTIPAAQPPVTQSN
ncbi:MAG: hypothetical protein ABUT20_65370 [Bacteroidota bacterium]